MASWLWWRLLDVAPNVAPLPWASWHQHATTQNVLLAIAAVAVPLVLFGVVSYVIGVLKTVLKYSVFAFGIAISITAGVACGIRLVFGDEFLFGLVRDCSRVRDPQPSVPSSSSWWSLWSLWF